MYPCCYGCIYCCPWDDGECEEQEDGYRFGPPSGRPPFGPGPGGPGPGGPGRPPFGPGGFDQGPQGPPPSYVPPRPQTAGFGPMAVDPRQIRRCLFRYTYIWLRNGRSFWAFPTMVGRNSLSGWRWNGRRWVYFGIDLRRIDYFQCG